jgi:hypothetical protein
VPEFIGNVSTSVELLAEALWFLCRPDRTNDLSDPAADVSTALTALTCFELHRHVVDQLDSEVAQLLELLFPNGLTETQKTLLLGWLNQRATSKKSERRLFTIRELLAEIGIFREIGVEDFCEGFLFYFLFYFEASSAHASLIGKIALKSGISPSN